MDPVQRKLALIDKQLSPGYFHAQLLRTSPFAVVALGLIAGILIESRVRPDGCGSPANLPFWLTALGLCIGSAVAYFFVRVNRNPDAYGVFVLGLLALTGSTCLGAVRLISFYRVGASDIRNFITEYPVLSTIRGLIVTEPRIRRNTSWAFSTFKPTDPASSFYLRLTQVKTISGWSRASGTIRVQVDQPVLDLQAGDYVQVYCWLDRVGERTNPGQFDVARYLARRNVFLAASVKLREGIEILQSPPSAFATKARRVVRRAAARALLGDLPAEESGYGLMQALLLGYRGDIDTKTYQAFRRTGLLHFLSLSGMHFGILVGIVWYLGRTAGLLKRGRAVVCILAIALFLVVVETRAATVRAAIIAWVFCASVLFRRKHEPLNALSLAAVVLLLIRPTQLFEAGWQLTFATVLGILLLCKRINYALLDWIERLCAELDYRHLWRLSRLVGSSARVIAPLFSTGLAAWVGAAGILLYHFYTITPLASLWTVVVFPLVAAVLTLGFLKVIVFFLLPTLSMVLGLVTARLSELLIYVVRLLGHLSALQILVGGVGLWLIVFYYGIVVFAFFVYFHRPFLKNLACTGLAGALLVFVGAVKWRHTHPTDLVFTCLDVSHGQAILAQFPGGSTALFDAGSLHYDDPGRRIVRPFLNCKGISNIDALFISHGDVDHINGIPELAELYEIGRVYANQGFLQEAARPGPARFLSEYLQRRGHVIQGSPTLVDFGGKAVVEKIWPAGDLRDSQRFSENDRSLVMLIRFGQRRILLCSDIEKAGQKEILRLNPGLKVDVVVAPHHGSLSTADPDFLNRLEPAVVICSCSRKAYERAKTRQLAQGAQCFYTAGNGAITVRVGKDGAITVETAQR